MLPAQHIQDKSFHSYHRAKTVLNKLKKIAKVHNTDFNEIKLLTKRDIVCNNLGAADAMIIWEAAPDDWIDELDLGTDAFVCCEIEDSESISFYDIF